MQVPLQISWEHIGPSEFIEGRIRREVASLERLFGRIISCRVAVEGRSQRQNKGGLYAVRIHLALPGGKEIDATRNPPSNHSHENAYVAVRDAFQAVKRQLRDTLRARAESSAHPNASEPHGLVVKLFADQGYGFIRADDGREIYFHKHAVLTGFGNLRVGAEVHFAEEDGREGPQASSVRAYGVSARV